MLVLGLLGIEEYGNLQINCIGQMLTALSILLTPFSTPIAQQFALRVAFFPSAALFLHFCSPSSFFFAHVAFIVFSAAITFTRPFDEGHKYDKRVAYIFC